MIFLDIFVLKYKNISFCPTIIINNYIQWQNVLIRCDNKRKQKEEFKDKENERDQ